MHNHAQVMLIVLVPRSIVFLDNVALAYKIQIVHQVLTLSVMSLVIQALRMNAQNVLNILHVAATKRMDVIAEQVMALQERLAKMVNAVASMQTLKSI